MELQTSKLCLIFLIYVTDNSLWYFWDLPRIMQSRVLHQVKDWKKPGLIVFDLDFTLWPFRVDKSAVSPFSISKKGNVIDTRGKVLKTFPEVPQLLTTLRNNGYTLAVASRIEDIPGAYQLLQLFGIMHYFQYKEIYPGTKTVHFNQLHAKTGVEFDRMIFFDDDKRNVRDVSSLGVMVFQVPQDGMTLHVLNTGLLNFVSTCHQ